MAQQWSFPRKKVMRHNILWRMVSYSDAVYAAWHSLKHSWHDMALFIEVLGIFWKEKCNANWHRMASVKVRDAVWQRESQCSASLGQWWRSVTEWDADWRSYDSVTEWDAVRHSDDVVLRSVTQWWRSVTEWNGVRHSDDTVLGSETLCYGRDAVCWWWHGSSPFVGHVARSSGSSSSPGEGGHESHSSPWLVSLGSEPPIMFPEAPLRHRGP